MALPAPTPPEKGLYTKEKIAVFSSAYMCQKPASLAYQEKKQLQEKSIIALKKKNFGKCRHKKQSLLPIESLGECKYASSLKELGLEEINRNNSKL